MESFKDKLRAVMTKREITEENTAREIGVTARTVHNWLHGVVPIPLHRKAAISWMENGEE